MTEEQRIENIMLRRRICNQRYMPDSNIFVGLHPTPEKVMEFAHNDMLDADEDTAWLIGKLKAANAKLAAVPVDAIRTYYNLSDTSPDAWAYWEDYREPFEKADAAVRDWLETQVTP